MKRTILFTESSPNVGGQELQLLAQMEGLQSRGHVTHLICREQSKIAGLARERALSISHAPFRNSLHLPSIMEVREQIRRFKPDVIVCHSGHDSNTAALAARTVSHRPRLIRSRTYLAGRVHSWSYNHLVDLTLVPSAYLRRQLLENRHVNADKIHVLYPGVIDEDACHHVQMKDDAGAANDFESRYVILHAAMLRPEKGHATLLEVIARLRQRYPDILYLIAGEGRHGEALQAQCAALGIGGNVRFMGMVKNIQTLMQRATLLVMPSLYEPLGMAQIEALQVGLPVLVSDIGGLPETVEAGVSGLLAPAGDVGAWVEAVDWALSHPQDMRAMAQVGAERVRQRFGKRVNIDTLLGHIERVLS